MTNAIGNKLRAAMMHAPRSWFSPVHHLPDWPNVAAHPALSGHEAEEAMARNCCLRRGVWTGRATKIRRARFSPLRSAS